MLAVTVDMQLTVQCGASSLTMDAAGNIALAGTKVSITSLGPVTVHGEAIELR